MQVSGLTLSCGRLLASLPRLLAQEPILRRHSILGALSFGTFGAFWTCGAELALDPTIHASRGYLRSRPLLTSYYENCFYSINRVDT
jgi:succinate-acetate transporter protein